MILRHRAISGERTISEIPRNQLIRKIRPTFDSYRWETRKLFKWASTAAFIGIIALTPFTANAKEAVILPDGRRCWPRYTGPIWNRNESVELNCGGTDIIRGYDAEIYLKSDRNRRTRELEEAADRLERASLLCQNPNDSQCWLQTDFHDRIKYGNGESVSEKIKQMRKQRREMDGGLFTADQPTVGNEIQNNTRMGLKETLQIIVGVLLFAIALGFLGKILSTTKSKERSKMMDKERLDALDREYDRLVEKGGTLSDEAVIRNRVAAENLTIKLYPYEEGREAYVMGATYSEKVKRKRYLTNDDGSRKI